MTVAAPVSAPVPIPATAPPPRGHRADVQSPDHRAKAQSPDHRADVQPRVPSTPQHRAADAPARAAAAPGSARIRLWAVATTVATVLLCLPFANAVLSLNDEGVLAHGALRLLRGQHLYADFFEILPPGGFVLAAGWFAAFGTSLLALRALAILTIAGIACFAFMACRRAGGGNRLAAGLTLGWVVMSQGLWTQLNHHWIATLFSMVALWASLERAASGRGGSRWPMLAGLSAGAAAMVMPTGGALAALAGLAVYLSPRRDWRGAAVYAGAAATVPACLALYVASTGAMAAALYEVLVFPAVHYARVEAVPFGLWANWQNGPLTYLFPAAGVLAGWCVVRDRRRGQPERPVLAGFAVAGFLGCFPRADVSHIGFAAPLALPLLAHAVASICRGWGPRRRRIAVCAGVGLCVVPALAFAFLVRKTMESGERLGPIVFVNQPGAAAALARIVAIPPGDGVFFYPYDPLLPFLAGRTQASSYEIFTPGYTPAAWYRDACEQIVAGAVWAVVDRAAADPESLRAAFPALTDPHPPEAAAFERMLETSFALVARDGALELRHRRAGLVPDCAAIGVQ